MDRQSILNPASHLQSQTAGITALKCGSHVLDQLPQTRILILQFGYSILRFLQGHDLLVALPGAGAKPAAGGVPPLRERRGAAARSHRQQLLSALQRAPQADLSLYVLAVHPDQQPAVLILAASLSAEVPAQFGVELSESEFAGQIVQNVDAFCVLRVFVQSQNFTQDVKLLHGDFACTLIVHVVENLLQILIQPGGQNNNLVLHSSVQSVMVSQGADYPLCPARWSAVWINGVYRIHHFY